MKLRGWVFTDKTRRVDGNTLYEGREYWQRFPQKKELKIFEKPTVEFVGFQAGKTFQAALKKAGGLVVCRVELLGEVDRKGDFFAAEGIRVLKVENIEEYVHKTIEKHLAAEGLERKEVKGVMNYIYGKQLKISRELNKELLKKVRGARYWFSSKKPGRAVMLFEGIKYDDIRKNTP